MGNQKTFRWPIALPLVFLAACSESNQSMMNKLGGEPVLGRPVSIQQLVGAGPYKVYVADGALENNSGPVSTIIFPLGGPENSPEPNCSLSEKDFAMAKRAILTPYSYKGSSFSMSRLDFVGYLEGRTGRLFFSPDPHYAFNAKGSFYISNSWPFLPEPLVALGKACEKNGFLVGRAAQEEQPE